MGGMIGGIASLASGIIGQQAAGSDRGHAQGLVDTGVNAWQGLQTPTNLANPLAFQNYQTAGQLTPAQQQYMTTGPAAAAGVQGNQNLVSAQMQALNAMKGVSQTGLTSADRARLNQIQQQMATQAEGQRQAVMQNYAQRGQAGSSNQLLAELNASQNAAQNANQQGLQAAGQAQTNALNALGQYGGMAGQMNTQQFGQQMQAAQAADLMNRFNVQNQIQQQAANVNAQNAAQQFNLQNQQGVMNANVGLANQNQMLQRQGQQQMFEDAAQRAAGLSGSSFTGANAYNNMGNQIAQGWQQIGQGAGQALGGSSGGGGGLISGITSLFAAHGGEIPAYANGGTIQASKDPNSLLFGSLTDDPSVSPIYKAPDSQFQTPTTIGQASPWEIGGGLAGSPYDNSGASLPSPGAGLGTDVNPMLNAAYGGEIANPEEEIPNLAYGGIAANPHEEIPNLYGGGQTYSNGGVAGVSTTSRGTYPAYQHGGYLTPNSYNEGGECYAMGGSPMPGKDAMPMISMLAGGHVPGKAKVKGDSFKNDHVRAMLSPGEVVIPRSIAQSEDAPEKAKQFVKRVKEKKEQK